MGGRRRAGGARPRAGRPRRRVPCVRRDAARAAHDLWPGGRRSSHDRVPRGEDARLSALPRPPQASALRGHGAREVRGLLALRGRLPGRVHPRRRGREHTGQSGLRRRAIRGGLRDQHGPLHLLRLLRDRLPVRRNHHGQRLRAGRLQPQRPDLHEGDAARRPARAHPASARGGVGAGAMWFEQVLFFVAGIGALAGALGVVLLQNPFYSVLSLVGHLLGLAVLFLLLHAEFLAAAQVVVYAGAVMVLYLFVVAYIGGADAPLRPESGGVALFGPLFAAAIAVELCIAFISSGLQALDTHGADLGPAFGSPGQIGELLLTDFLLPFEAASFLLLVAAVGAVVLARRRRGLEEVGTGAATEGGRPPSGRREPPTETLEVRV